ncbi:hypothetical protein [Sorangium sp. So ce542]|uniref:hypothetical protein n=1 Tax=Sorangium sp. So ce542 TaxID=3133316 RepID=UPI003F62C0C5
MGLLVAEPPEASSLPRAPPRALVGEIVLESSVFRVEGSDGLSMFVFSPADEASARGVAQLVRRSGS